MAAAFGAWTEAWRVSRLWGLRERAATSSVDTAVMHRVPTMARKDLPLQDVVSVKGKEDDIALAAELARFLRQRLADLVVGRHNLSAASTDDPHETGRDGIYADEGDLEIRDSAGVIAGGASSNQSKAISKNRGNGKSAGRSGASRVRNGRSSSVGRRSLGTTGIDRKRGG